MKTPSADSTSLALSKIYANCFSNDHIPALQFSFNRSGEVYEVFRDITGKESWHIGSCGKALTAHLIHKLIEEKVFSYDTVVFKNVTIANLLCHSSGIKSDYPDEIWKDLIPSAQSTEVKRQIIFDYWKQQPAVGPSEYNYSNWNYILAAHFASQKMGKSFEDLMKTRIFETLNMRSAGFGAPDILWGNIEFEGKVHSIEPSIHADNPPFFAPAGGMHVSASDWGKFITEQMKQSDNWANFPSSKINATTDYLVTGWVREIVGGDPRYTHSGCNKLWSATAVFIPSEKTFWTIQTNCGSDQALNAIQAASLEISKIK